MRTTIFTAALLATNLVSAATPVDGMYARVFGGYNYLPNNISNTTYGVLYTNSSYKNGYNAGASFGFQSNPLRYEIEFTYLTAQTNGFDINNIFQTGVTGSSSADFLMANIFYDLPEMVPAISPYVGVGLGYAYVQSTLNSTGPLGITFIKFSDNEFSYQATGGFTYNFAENFGAQIGYRYLATATSTSLGKVFQAHIANAGIIYHFDRGNYK